VSTIILNQTNVAIANFVAEILMEFAEKEADAKKLMEAERRATREFEEKAAHNTGYPAWQTYWRQHREEAEVVTAVKRAVARAARREATSCCFLCAPIYEKYHKKIFVAQN
jgi:hypothetical protein